MTYDQIIATKLNLTSRQVAAAIILLDEGNTLPFIARYRKEMTGGLDEEQIRLITAQIENLRALDDRRATILALIEEQGKLTPELREQIMEVNSRTILEDLYLPYKPKRRTRASIAREKGLQGLAEIILDQVVTRETIDDLTKPYLNDEVTSCEEALAGARDIVAEIISETPEVRQAARIKAMRWGTVHIERIDGSEDPKRVFELYYSFDGRVDLLRPHQVLAINRGEEDKILRVRVVLQERDWREAIAIRYTTNPRSIMAEQMAIAVRDGADRLLLPAIEREVRSTLTERAGAHAISVFAANLRALLNQPPLAGHIVMGIDPGFRTGCKVAIVDVTGKVLEVDTIYPHEPQKKHSQPHHVGTEIVLSGLHHADTDRFRLLLVRS